MTFEEYQDFYQILPEKVQKKLEIDWGKAPGEVFKYDDFLLIPGTLNGNILLLCSHLVALERILTRFIIHRIVPRHIITLRFIIGCVIFGVLMPWFMWVRMDH